MIVAPRALWRGRRGSSPLMEMSVVVVPLLLLLSGIIAADRLFSARYSAGAAAQEAVAAVAAAPDRASALTAGEARARAAAVALDAEVVGVELTVPNSFARGAEVTATVQVTVALDRLPLIGLPAVTVEATRSRRIGEHGARPAGATQ